MTSYSPSGVGVHGAEVTVQFEDGGAVLAVELRGNVRGFDLLENAVRQAFEDSYLAEDFEDEGPVTFTLCRPDGSSFKIDCDDQEDFQTMVVGVRIVSWAKGKE